MSLQTLTTRWLRALLSLWVLWVPAQGLALTAQGASASACGCDHHAQPTQVPPATPAAQAAEAPTPDAPRPCCPTKAQTAQPAKAQAEQASGLGGCCDDQDRAASAPGDGDLDHDCGCVTSDSHDQPLSYVSADAPADALSLAAPPAAWVVEQPLWRWERRAFALPRPRAPDWPQRPLHVRLCVWLK